MPTEGVGTMETLQERDTERSDKPERYNPSLHEELKRDAIHDTHDKLKGSAKNKVDELALVATEEFRHRYGTKYGFGQVSAIELIGKLGLWMVKNDVKPVKLEKCPCCGHMHPVEVEDV